MNLLSVQGTGALLTLLLLILCFALSGFLRALPFLRPKKPPEEKKEEPKEPETVYYIVEKKKKRAKAEYSEPKRISFK